MGGGGGSGGGERERGTAGGKAGFLRWLELGKFRKHYLHPVIQLTNHTK